LISPAAILRELVSIPTVSSQSNRTLVEWLQRFFEPLGWYGRVLSYIDSEGNEKLNFIVSPETLDEDAVRAELAIVCHTDTVPYAAAWNDATQLREVNGMLHGLHAGRRIHAQQRTVEEAALSGFYIRRGDWMPRRAFSAGTKSAQGKVRHRRRANLAHAGACWQGILSGED
jgi:hypothetical protein